VKRWSRWGETMLLVVLPVLLYGRSLTFPLLDYDDPIYVGRNPAVRAPGFAGLRQAWSSPYFHDYIPLTHSSLWMDARLGGGSALPFRAQNLAWHIACSLLVAAAARRWIGERQGFLVALLFAVHPMAVESVAWVAARKNVLSLALYLGAYLAWCRGEETGRRAGGRIATGALFVLSLLAKPAGMGFPLVIGADAWLLRRRGPLRATAAALPFAVIAAGWLAFAIRLRHDIPDSPAAGPVGLLAIDLQVLARYALNTIAPAVLSAFYFVDLSGFASGAVWIGAAVLAGGIALPFVWIRRRAAAGFLLLWCLAGLLPALNVVPQPHPIADRFFYWSLPGFVAFLVLAAADGLDAMARRREPVAPLLRRAVPFGAAAVTIAFALLTVARAEAWHSSRRLFEDAVRKSPRCAVAHLHLGNVLSNNDSQKDKARAALIFERMFDCPDASVIKPIARDNATLYLALVEVAGGETGKADLRMRMQFAGREAAPDAQLFLSQYDLASGRPGAVIDRLERSVFSVPGLRQLAGTISASPGMPYRSRTGRLSRESDFYIAAQQREGLIRALTLLGQAYLKTDRPPDAVVAFSLVATMAPLDGELLTHLAAAYRASGDEARAGQAEADLQALSMAPAPSAE